MGKKTPGNLVDDGSVSMTMLVPADIYFYLKKLALLDRRSMKQETFYIIEQAAKEKGIVLDHDDDNVKKLFMTMASIPDEYIPVEKGPEDFQTQEKSG